MNKWKSRIDITCQFCGKEYQVQYQTMKAGGGKYCSRMCNPNISYTPHNKGIFKSPLGAQLSLTVVRCQSCNKSFETMIRNLSRGGGKYCCRKCNPSYAPWELPSNKYRRHNLKSNYGITVEDFDLLAKNQNGVCAICGEPPHGENTFLHIDHDHSTGKIRGLLCRSCNRALGWFRDDITILNSAVEYIKTHGGKTDAKG